MPKGIYQRNQNAYPCLPRKFSPKDDQKISKLYKSGFSQEALAKKFDVGKKTIRASLLRTNTSTTGRKSMPMEKNPAWKGGRIKDYDGYILLKIPDHPLCNSLGYILEHRLIMEKALGRYLTKKEVVHHKNGKKDDNRIENLLLFSDNGYHLGVELLGRVPKWTKEGRQKIASRKVPSMKGIHQSPKGSGVRRLRKKLIEKFLHETSEMENIGLEAEPLPLPSFRKRLKK